MDKHYDDLKNPIRGRVFDEDMIVDIKEYYINNLKDNDFVSTYKNRNFCVDDFIYFIIPKEVFKDIYQQAYNQGLKYGKKENITE